MEAYLPKFGFTKVTKKSQIKPGAVVAVKYDNHNYIDHVFVVEYYYLYQYNFVIYNYIYTIIIHSN